MPHENLGDGSCDRHKELACRQEHYPIALIRILLTLSLGDTPKYIV